jgi:hypothetical protein
MIRAAIIAIPLLIGGYSATLTLQAWTVVFGLLGIALTTGGAALRRYPLIVGGAVASLANYVSALPALDTPPNIWMAVAVGLGIFLLLELGYDWIHAVRRPVSRRIYAPRILHFALVAAVSFLITFLAVTLGYNVVLRISGDVPFWLGVLGVTGAVAIAGILILFWLKNREKEGTESANEQSSGERS